MVGEGHRAEVALFASATPARGQHSPALGVDWTNNDLNSPCHGGVARAQEQAHECFLQSSHVLLSGLLSNAMQSESAQQQNDRQNH